MERSRSEALVDEYMNERTKTRRSNAGLVPLQTLMAHGQEVPYTSDEDAPILDTSGNNYISLMQSGFNNLHRAITGGERRHAASKEAAAKAEQVAYDRSVQQQAQDISLKKFQHQQMQWGQAEKLRQDQETIGQNTAQRKLDQQYTLQTYRTGQNKLKELLQWGIDNDALIVSEDAQSITFPKVQVGDVIRPYQVDEDGNKIDGSGPILADQEYVDYLREFKDKVQGYKDYSSEAEKHDEKLALEQLQAAVTTTKSDDFNLPGSLVADFNKSQNRSTNSQNKLDSDLAQVEGVYNKKYETITKGLTNVGVEWLKDPSFMNPSRDSSPNSLIMGAIRKASEMYGTDEEPFDARSLSTEVTNILKAANKKGGAFYQRNLSPRDQEWLIAEALPLLVEDGIFRLGDIKNSLVADHPILRSRINELIKTREVAGQIQQLNNQRENDIAEIGRRNILGGPFNFVRD